MPCAPPGGAPRLVQRAFTVLCAAVGVVLGLVAYAVALGLGAGASVDGAFLAAVIGGVAFALASRTLAARALGVRALWLVARLVVRRFIPISPPAEPCRPAPRVPFRGWRRAGAANGGGPSPSGGSRSPWPGRSS